jgi:ABC-type phosphate transport system substrate-binding protein
MDRLRTIRCVEGWRQGLRRLLAAAAVLAGLGSAPARADEIVVVVNDRVAATSLTAEQVRAIFLGERHYWDGQRTFPVTYSDQTQIMRDFLSRVLGMDVNQYKSYWIKRIFREGDVPPSRAVSGAEVLRAVAGNAGGIGFVEVKDLGAAAGVHPVFRIEG